MNLVARPSVISSVYRSMPRNNSKCCPTATGVSRDVETTAKSMNTNKNNDNFTEIQIKMESPIDFELPNTTVPDLSKYKYEKKSPIKIEFEHDVEVKNEEVKGLWEPAHWQEFLLNLRNMRANNDAPVDSMGSHKSMDEKASPVVYRYQCLISLMLSSQTKDQVTFAAMERLRAKGLTVENVLQMSDEELGTLIYPVGFWKTKVKYIKKTTQTLKDLYNSDIPDSVEKLCKLTGVGPKMAHICMKVAWDKVTGIGVDTHVHRISNRIGWVRKPTPTPEDTRKALQSWLPFELWSEVNHLMVGFGQTICLPIGPHCNECLNNDICPSSSIGKKSPKKTSIKTEKHLDIKTEKIPQKKYLKNNNLQTHTKKMNLLNDQLKTGIVKSTEQKSLNTAQVPVLSEIDSNNDIIADEDAADVKSELQKSPRKRKSTPRKIDNVEQHLSSDKLNDTITETVTTCVTRNTASNLLLHSEENMKSKKLSLKRKSPKCKVGKNKDNEINDVVCKKDKN